MSARNEKNRNRVLREAMVQIFALQLRLGSSIEEVRSNAQSAIQLANRDAVRSMGDMLNADVHQFGSVLRTWHRETKFLSREGFPRHLGASGRSSLRSLVNMHYPRQQFDAVVKSLSQAGMIKRDKQGKWFPTTRHAVFPALSGELLAHFSEGVARLIETISRNVESQNKEKVLFERACKVLQLPVSAGPAFREFVNGQALAFLETVDDWLESQVEVGKKSKEKKCTAGVFAFAFMDELPARQLRQAQSV